MDTKEFIMKNLPILAVKEREERIRRLIELLDSLDLTYTVMNFNNKWHQVIKSNRDVFMKNIIIGKESNDYLLLTAHFDNVPTSIGDNDNMAAVLMLIAFIVNHRELFESGKVMVALTDGEEMLGYGSDVLSSYMIANEHKVTVINFDTIGTGKKVVILDTEKAKDKKRFDELLKLNDKTFLSNHNCVTVPHLPFSDATIFRSHGFDATCICALPEEDISEANLNLGLVNEIFRYIHGGDRDSIEWIDYEMIMQVYKYLEDIVY